MFRIKNAVSTHVQQRNFAPASQTNFVKDDEVVIKFSKGQSAIYNRDQIEEHFDKLKLPEEGLPLDLSQIDHEIFKIIVAVVVENKHPSDVLPETAYRNPFIIDDLQAALAQLGKEKITSFVEHSCYLNRQQAIASMQGYAEAQKANNPRLKEIPNPIAVTDAGILLNQAKLFFTTDKEADDVFLSRQLYRKEFCICEYLITDLEKALENPKSSMQEILLKAQLINLSRQQKFCEEKLAEIEAKMNVNFINMMAKQNLMQFINSEDEFIRLTALQAQKILEDYKSTVLEALRKSDANLKRTDLLEWLIGPKGFLLDRYGITYEPTNKLKFPFKKKWLDLGYRLDNEGPYDLEEEIRNDLSKNYIPLIPRIIQLEEKTKPITEEVKQILDKVMPFLKKFPTPETQSGTPPYQEFIELLWEFNGWDKLGVDPKNITLEEVERNKDPIIGKGKVALGKSIWSFQFKSDDLILLIDPGHRYTGSDRTITKELILKCLPQETQP